MDLRFAIPCIFNHSNKTPNLMQKSIVKFIALSYRHCSTCFGHYNDRLLMMGIVMPETC